jgi:hypothetical protein
MEKTSMKNLMIVIEKADELFSKKPKYLTDDKRMPLSSTLALYALKTKGAYRS